MADSNPRRELMFCHQCENEWYRDEHGIICPECHSDFCEVIEQNDDPRLQEPDPPIADDPDEGDIDDLRWTANQPGAPPGMHMPYMNYQNPPTQDQGQESGGSGGGIAGFLGSVIGGLLGVGQQPQQQGSNTQSGHYHPATGEQRAPGSPPGSPQGGTRVRHFHAPGFHMTFATSTNLHPRNAHEPQPFQQHPQHIEAMMNQMLMNIGAVHAPHNGGGMFYGGPEMRGGNGMGFGPGAMPFENIFRLLGATPGGVHGDAVFSQEALDRIITQLMDQHRSGNAPPPASEEAIRNLPSRTITEKDMDEKGKAECSICMDDVPVGETVTELPCHHWFHFECVKHWLTEHDTCPHCRQGIMPRETASPGPHVPRAPTQAPLHNTHTQQYAQMPGSFPFTAPPGNPPPPPRTRPSDAPPPSRDSNGRRNSAGNMFKRMRDAFGSGSPNEQHPGGGGGGGGPSSGAAGGSSSRT